MEHNNATNTSTNLRQQQQHTREQQISQKLQDQQQQQQGNNNENQQQFCLRWHNHQVSKENCKGVHVMRIFRVTCEKRMNQSCL